MESKNPALSFMRSFLLGVFFMLSACARPQYLNQNVDHSRKAGASDCFATFKQNNICVDIKWEKIPTESEMGSFIFTTVQGANGVLTDLTSDTPIKVILWMPSMGHGSSPVEVEHIAFGLYRAKNVFFNMKGDWEIRFQTSHDQAIYALTL